LASVVWNVELRIVGASIGFAASNESEVISCGGSVVNVDRKTFRNTFEVNLTKEGLIT
jgi:hypothetical protein